MLFYLAQWQILDGGDLLKWLAIVAVLLSLFVLALQARKLWQENYGRKPGLDDDLRSQKQVLADLKHSLAGLAPNEKVERLIERLGSFATQEQIRAIEIQLPGLINREELERCLGKLERDLDARVKEMSAYVHRAVHDLRGDVNAMRISVESGREGIHDRINLLVEATAGMRGMLEAIRGAWEGPRKHSP